MIFALLVAASLQASWTAPSAAGLEETATWNYSTLGENIGLGGMAVSTAGGTAEIVTTCGGGSSLVLRFWIVLRYEAATASFEQAFSSPIYPATGVPRRLVVADVRPDSGPEIVVARQDGLVEVWNQATRQRLTTIACPVEPTNVACADINADGRLDFVVTTATQTVALDNNGTPLWSNTSAAGEDAVVGQMDTDPALELATTNGTILDLGTRQVQWTVTPNLGFRVRAADIDADGLDELITVPRRGPASAFDVDQQIRKWTIASGNNSAMELADLDRDGEFELLIGAQQAGSVFASSTRTTQLLWTLSRQESGVPAIATGDLTGDGNLELLFSAGSNTTSGPERLYVCDSRRQTLWSSLSLMGPIQGPVVGDIDGDGRDEIVAGVPNTTSIGNGRLLVFDASSRRLRGVFVGAIDHQTVSHLALANVDGDRDQELLVTGAERVAVLDWDGQRFKNIWEVRYPCVPCPGLALAGDFDSNGKIDIAVGATSDVVVHRFSSKEVIWRTSLGSAQVIQLMAFDSDFDGTVELHVLATDGRLRVFDGRRHSLDAVITPPAGRRFTAVANYGNATTAAIVLGDSQGALHLALPNAGAYTTLGPVPLTGSAIDSIELADPLPVLVIGSAERVWLFAQSTLAWRTAGYGPYFGQSVELLARPTPMLVSAGMHGVHAFALQ